MKSLLYLSGAPRVSTKADSATTGARAHVVGVINSFEKLGIKVIRYIVGDMVSKSMSGGGAQKRLSSSLFLRIAADFYRIWSGKKHAKAAFATYGDSVDIVYERFGAFQSLGRIFQKLGKKWILETNSPLFMEAKSERKSLALSGLAKKLEIQAYTDCDLLICITHELKDIIVNECKINPDKIFVMPNAVDIDKFDPQKIEPVRYFDGFTVGFVGNLYAWAGLDLLFEAIQHLKAQDLLIHAVIIGDGLMRESWEAKVRELGIDNLVIFTGRLSWEQIPSHMAGFDLAYSGQVAMKLGKMYHSPLKLYEYMAMGNPVLASSFEEASKLIEHGVNGYLFRPGDLDDLVKHLKEILKDSEFHNKGIAARKSIMENHTWDKRVEELINKINLL